MNRLQMIAIPTKVAELVRATMKSPGYGHPAHKEIATGYGPCRHCLKTFRVGEEERILFTYDPVHELAPYPLPGPIFIHAESCERHEEHDGLPRDLQSQPLTLVAYGEERTVLAKEYVAGGDGDIERVAQGLLNDSRVQYLHVRDTEAGCYDLRIERS